MHILSLWYFYTGITVKIGTSYQRLIATPLSSKLGIGFYGLGFMLFLFDISCFVKNSVFFASGIEYNESKFIYQ